MMEEVARPSHTCRADSETLKRVCDGKLGGKKKDGDREMERVRSGCPMMAERLQAGYTTAAGNLLGRNCD